MMDYNELEYRVAVQSEGWIYAFKGLRKYTPE